MSHYLPHPDAATTHALNTAAVVATPIIWTNVLDHTMQAIATLFTIVWMGIQIAIAFQKYLEHRAKHFEGPPGPRGPMGPSAPVVVVPTIKVETVKEK